MSDIGDWLIAIVVLSIPIILLSLFIAPIWGIYYGYSDGERTGDIYKFSKKGLIWKSWEGEMYLGGVHSTGGNNAQLELDKFYFSIPASEENEKSELIETLKKCAKERKICTVNYKQWLVSPYSVNSSYIVQ